MRIRMKSGRGVVTVVLLAAFAATLSGCGQDAANRMSGGTASGAATGATFGLIGGPIGVLVGGAIGGGIGALTAANTTPKQIDLGNPPWAGGQTSSPQGQPTDLRGQINDYRAGQSQSSANDYNTQPQPLTPTNQASQPGYGSVGQGTYGDTVQSQSLPPPSTR